jgi:hypothetical protein
MYMQALLGPAMVGRQMLLVQVTFDSMPEIKKVFIRQTKAYNILYLSV